MKPRSSKSAEDVVIDDPCWGDPQHCSLERLLTLVSRSKLILYETKDYLALHKPADLRMDGPYPATVHKLLTYWYPPPSLLKEACASTSLLSQLKDLHRHSEIPDNELRPAHQLDYATSGVLLVARSGSAAAWASGCFESRRVQKAYLAVLHGHVNVDQIVSSSRPLVCPERLTQIVQQEELQYRRTQHKKRPETFLGFQPPNAFLQIFQGRYARKLKPSTKKRRRERLTHDQWEQVDKALQLTDEEQELVAKMPWKDVRNNAKFRNAVEHATQQYNDYLRDILKAEQEQSAAYSQSNIKNKDLPPVFRVEGDDDSTFYVYMAVAQVAEEFAMRIPQGYQHDWLKTGETESMNFKTALTRCTVVTHGRLQGQPVTKVRLEPRTGRRHQLRVHTAFLGHPIVGDQTYEDPTMNNNNLSPRMCLHAFSLGFPLPAEEGATNPNVQESGAMLEVTASDPFPVTADKAFSISSM